MPQETSLLRASRSHADSRVGFVELFFDLVFVFAITQLSHALLHHFTWAKLGETAFLTFAVWWVWMYTTWAMNWLNPQATLVRVMLFALMLAGLILSASIPEAFGEHGLRFGAAYAFMHVARTVFLCLALKGSQLAGQRRNFERILVYLCASGACWIAGGFFEGPERWLVWSLALSIEVLGPWNGYWTPGMGRSTTADWNVSGAHMAERCGLFIIIALGESLLVTGTMFAGLEWSPTTLAAFAVAFLGAIVMWQLYFGIAAEDASAEFEHARDPGRIARVAYTYLHIPIVFGIVLSAVSDEITLAHPLNPPSLLETIAILGGPMVFLLGALLFKRASFGEFSKSHILGVVLLAGLFLLAPRMSALALAAAAVAILFAAAVWERIAVGRWKAANPAYKPGDA